MSVDWQMRMLAVSYARLIGLAGMVLALVILGLIVGLHLSRADDTRTATITKVEPIGDTITDSTSGDGYMLEVIVPGVGSDTAFVGPGSYHRGGTVRVWREGNHWRDYRLNTDGLIAAAIIAGWAAIILALDGFHRRVHRRRRG